MKSVINERNIEVEIQWIDDGCSFDQSQIIIELIREERSVFVYALSVKVLKMQCGSIFLHLRVDALPLIFITDESSPCLLDSHCCTCPFQ